MARRDVGGEAFDFKSSMESAHHRFVTFRRRRFFPPLRHQFKGKVRGGVWEDGGKGWKDERVER